MVDLIDRSIACMRARSGPLRLSVWIDEDWADEIPQLFSEGKVARAYSKLIAGLQSFARAASKDDSAHPTTKLAYSS
jgi:hypothetical protein